MTEKKLDPKLVSQKWTEVRMASYDIRTSRSMHGYSFLEACFGRHIGCLN